MTSTLERAGRPGWPDRPDASAADSQQRTGSRRRSWFARDPAWPIEMLLVGWPLWWALGFAEYASVIFAIPMVWRMYHWRARRTREIKKPKGFAVWLLFLLMMVASLAMIAQTAPDTMPSPASSRVISWSVRALSYLSATVLLLYAGNLTEEELPRKKLAYLLGLVGIYALAGGFIGLADPTLRFTSPLQSAVPASLQASNGGEIYTMLHPGFTQSDSFQGHGRVTAPFLYTNSWSNNIVITLPWLLVAWRSTRKNRPSQRAVILLVAALIPALLSYDRGLWIAIVLGVVYMAVRLARQGKAALLAAICGVALIGALVVLLSPLQNLITQRLQNGSSDTARSSLTVVSIKEALDSPLLGWGDTRREYGSQKSAAIGRTANCTKCGNRSAGSNGQLWLLLITTGIPGTLGYLGFIGYGAWQFRRDKTPYGMVGEFVLLVSFMFMFIYDAVGGTLIFTMLAYVLLWRNHVHLEQERQQQAEVDAARPGQSTPKLGDVQPSLLPFTG